jgi:hypothetical protein
MHGSKPITTRIAVIALTATLTLTCALAAHAATTVTTVDPTGAQFTCGATTYTVTGGTLQIIQSETAAANGSSHLSLKRIPHNVTLADGSTDRVYRLAGAGSSNGQVSTTGQFAFTDVTHFHILAPNGAPVGIVATILRLNRNGSGFSFDFGNCQSPQEG